MRHARTLPVVSRQSPTKKKASRKEKQRTKVLLAQRFAREPEPAERSAQVRVVLRDEARGPVAVAAPVERVGVPSREEGCGGLRDGHG